MPSNLRLSLDGGQQEGDERGGNTYTHTLQERDGAEVGQPVILSDSDILSFSIDHGALNISTGTHASSHFSKYFIVKREVLNQRNERLWIRTF